MKKLFLFILIIILGIAIIPWTLYEIGLQKIQPLPNPPHEINLTQSQSQQLWLKFGEIGPIQVERLNPYQYLFSIFFHREYENSPGGKVAWFVARDYNLTHLNTKNMGVWHLSGAALTVWLTRNWSIDQLLMRAEEIQVRKKNI